MSTEPRPADRPHPSRAETAPLGIKIVCAFSGVTTLLAGAVGLSVLSIHTGLGLVVLILAVVQLVVLYGLWTLEPWAWTWGIVVFGLNVPIQLLEVNILGVLISIGIVLYIASVREYYRESDRPPR